MAQKEIEMHDRVRYIGPDNQVVGNPFVVVGRSSRTDHPNGKKYYSLQLILEIDYDKFGVTQVGDEVRFKGAGLQLIEVPDYDVEHLDNSLKIE